MIHFFQNHNNEMKMIVRIALIAGLATARFILSRNPLDRHFND